MPDPHDPRDPNLGATLRIIMFMLIVVIGIGIGRVRADDAPETVGRCFTPEYFQKLSSMTHQWGYVPSDPSKFYAFICDDMVNQELETQLTNQVWAELRCAGYTLQVWVVNCNEA